MAPSTRPVRIEPPPMMFPARDRSRPAAANAAIAAALTSPTLFGRQPADLLRGVEGRAQHGVDLQLGPCRKMRRQRQARSRARA